jgi:lipopolysaccharide biosynthesis regulator YciM
MMTPTQTVGFTAKVVECRPLVRQILDKGEKRWKTSVQLFRRHEKIVNEFVMHYRCKDCGPYRSTQSFWQHWSPEADARA